MSEQSFWARRRAGVAEEAAAEERQLLETEQTALEEKTDAEILAEFDLPDPDTLKQGDDFSVFMSKAIPDRLRRRALRKLWLSNPVLANVDSLVDYGEDFTDSAMVIENMQTTYQVGKGMLKHLQELARQAEETEAAEELIEEEVPEEEVPEEEVALAIAEAPELAVAHPEEVTTEDVEMIAAPRRMKFISEDAA